MPATALAIQTITEAGMTPVAPVNGDNTNGNSFANTGKQWVEATNSAGASATLTVAFPYLVHGQTIPAKSYTVAASGSLRVGPFDPALFGTTVVLTPSASTLKLAVFQSA
jgi:hypothetical protein